MTTPQRKAAACRSNRTQRALLKGKLAGRTPVETIVARAAVGAGIDIEDVLGDGRTHQVVVARREAIAAVRRVYPEMSVPRLARHFRRDASTMLHSLRLIGIEADEP